MDNEPKEPVVEPTEIKTDEPKVNTPTLEDVLKQNKELMDSIETQKKEISGINKANTKFQEDYNNLLKTHETEAETIAREKLEDAKVFEDEKNSLVNERSTLLKEKNDFQIQLKASELRLDLEAVKAFNFSTVEQVELYAKQLELIRESAKEETTKNIEKGLSGLDQKDYKNDPKNTEQLTPLEMKIINRR